MEPRIAWGQVFRNKNKMNIKWTATKTSTNKGSKMPIFLIKNRDTFKIICKIVKLNKTIIRHRKDMEITLIII